MTDWKSILLPTWTWAGQQGEASNCLIRFQWLKDEPEEPGPKASCYGWGSLGWPAERRAKPQRIAAF